MTSVGTGYLGAILSGDYVLIWISTPSDWYVRTPGKRIAPHWACIQNMLTKASKLRMKIVMFGPPGYIWKLQTVRDTLEDLKLHVIRMRLCHFGMKFNKHDSTPSGSYMQIATTLHLSTKLWECKCKLDIPQHVLDWYGKTPRHAEWRSQTRIALIQHFNDHILGTKSHGNVLTYMATYTRTDHNIQHYVTTRSGGPKWSEVV